MPAAVSAIVTALVEDEESGAASPAVDLRQVWAEITDPRDRRGRRHSLVVILTQAAVVSGTTSFVAIRHWIGAVPQRLAERARSEWTIENRDHYVRDVSDSQPSNESSGIAHFGDTMRDDRLLAEVRAQHYNCWMST